MKFNKTLILSAALLTVSCSNMNKLSMNSVSDISNVGGISTPKIGDVNVVKAVDAAKELKDAAMVSDEEISKMSLGLAQHSDRTNKVAPAGSSYTKRINKIISKHSNEDGLKLNYKVYLSQELNAFSLADGSIRVYSGLMDLLNDDELLAVIGHEIGHVKLGHSADRVRIAHLASGITKAAGSTSNVAGLLADESMLGGLFEKVVTSQFSQSQETDSDEYSINFLKKNGYNLNAEVTAFNKLAELEGKPNFADSLFASHPASEERAKHIADIIGGKAEIKVANTSNSGTTDAGSSAPSTALASTNETTSPKTAKTASLGKAHSMASVRESDSLPSGWYVQVAAATEKAAAQEIEDDLTRNGFKAMQQAAVVNGTQYHRVIVGPFSQKSTAEQTKQKVMASSITREVPFIKLVK